MPSTNFPATQPELTVLVPSQDVGRPATAQLDQMELDLKRLRLDAEQLSASIKQLEVQDLDGAHPYQLSSDSWNAGALAWLLGASLLLAGTLLVWRLVAARKHISPQDFVESGLYPPRVAAQGAVVNKAPAPLEVHGGVWQEDSDWEAAPSANEFLAPKAHNGFDFEAAASEVERVRKSLAQKREQREILRHALASSPPALVATPTHSEAPQYAEVPAQKNGVALMDSELEFDLDVEQAPTPFIEPAAISAVHTEPSLEEVDDALSVKLALAQEFYALGLSVPARELANEVIESGNPALLELAREVVSHCDAQEHDLAQQQQGYAALVHSLRDAAVNDVAP